MTVTELREALQAIEERGHGAAVVVLDDDPYLEFDRCVASDDFQDGAVRACLVNSETPGHR